MKISFRPGVAIVKCQGIRVHYKSTKEKVESMQKVLLEMGLVEDNTPKDFPKVYPTFEELINHD